MDKVYLILMTLAVLALGYEAFSGTTRDGSGRRRVSVNVLALGLLFWAFVTWLIYADRVFSF